MLRGTPRASETPKKAPSTYLERCVCLSFCSSPLLTFCLPGERVDPKELGSCQALTQLEALLSERQRDGAQN
jgi:hypothetical protein